MMTGGWDTTAARRQRGRLTAVRLLGALAVLIPWLGGCAHAPPLPPPLPPAAPPPQSLDVEVRAIASPDLNPNRSGRPSPVFLRVFELRDPSKFLNAEFDDVTLRADTTLAATLIGREERMVEPGSSVLLVLKIDPQTRVLGIVAEYSDLANSRWRAITPAPAGGLLMLFKEQSLVIHLDRQAVSAAAVPAKGK